MKISTARLKQIIKEELFYRQFHREGQELRRVIRETENQTDMIPYEDYDAWDSDPNLERIEQVLSSELDLCFKFHLSTDFPGQYRIATRGGVMGLGKKTGYQLKDVEGALQANGYETDYSRDGLVAIDPRYSRETK